MNPAGVLRTNSSTTTGFAAAMCTKEMQSVPAIARVLELRVIQEVSSVEYVIEFRRACNPYKILTKSLGALLLTM